MYFYSGIEKILHGNGSDGICTDRPVRLQAPRGTRQVLEALRANEGAAQSELFVFSDGPKDAGERGQVEAVRALFDSLPGFAGVTLREWWF